MLKKRLALYLSIVLVIVAVFLVLPKGKLTDLFSSSPTSTSPEDNGKRSILIIGNSHSIDAFWLLYQAYTDQYPDVDLTVGILHYKSASIDQHISFIENEKAVMRYYINKSGWWKIKYDVTPQSALTDYAWDTILLQPNKDDLEDSNLNRRGQKKLMKLVDKYVTTPHTYVWHVSWPSPDEEIIFSPEFIRQPPEGYRETLEKLYGFNSVYQYSLMLEKTEKHVLNRRLYDQYICSGAAIMQAHLTQGVSQLDLWRDYTHLSDYGRLMAGYAITAQLTGKPIQSIGIDEITVHRRHKQNKPQGDLLLTDEMKKAMVEAVNYSLSNPWIMPPETATTTTALIHTTTPTTTSTIKTTTTTKTTGKTKTTKTTDD